MKILDIPQSGKRGLTVSQNGRYGQISRAYVMPANPQTAAQMQVRATFGTVASAWDGLTEAQRQAWIAAASTRQTKTRCGTSGPMTGLQFFVQVNANLLAMGQDQVTAPPAPPVFQPNAPQNLVITNPAGVVAMKLTCPTAPGENHLILASAPQKAGVSVCNNYRVIGSCPAAVGGSADITAIYPTVFGAPPPGTKVFVSVHQMTNGFTSVPSKFNAIVPAKA